MTGASTTAYRVQLAPLPMVINADGLPIANSHVVEIIFPGDVIETALGKVNTTKALRQISPWCSRSGDPQASAQELPIVRSRTAAITDPTGSAGRTRSHCSSFNPCRSKMTLPSSALNSPNPEKWITKRSHALARLCTFSSGPGPEDAVVSNVIKGLIEGQDGSAHVVDLFHFRRCDQKRSLTSSLVLSR